MVQTAPPPALRHLDAHLSAGSFLLINASCVDLKKSFRATNASPDAVETKLGVELHVFAERDTQESMECAESSIVALINLLTESNASVSLDSKESTQFAETSLAPQINFSTEINASAFKDIKELTLSVK